MDHSWKWSIQHLCLRVVCLLQHQWHILYTVQAANTWSYPRSSTINAPPLKFILVALFQTVLFLPHNITVPTFISHDDLLACHLSSIVQNPPVSPARHTLDGRELSGPLSSTPVLMYPADSWVKAVPRLLSVSRETSQLCTSVHIFTPSLCIQRRGFFFSRPNISALLLFPYVSPLMDHPLIFSQLVLLSLWGR